MDMTRLLLALHPRRWRETFGDEFAALLDDTRLTPSVLVNVLIHAGRLCARAHRRILLVFVALAWSIGLEVISLRAKLTANVLWAPTQPLRAVALMATVGPWLVLAGSSVVRRRRA